MLVIALVCFDTEFSTLKLNSNYFLQMSLEFIYIGFGFQPKFKRRPQCHSFRSSSRAIFTEIGNNCLSYCHSSLLCPLNKFQKEKTDFCLKGLPVNACSCPFWELKYKLAFTRFAEHPKLYAQSSAE